MGEQFFVQPKMGGITKSYERITDISQQFGPAVERFDWLKEVSDWQFIVALSIVGFVKAHSPGVTECAFSEHFYVQYRAD